MSEQWAITSSKSAIKTQEKVMKQARSQQYRHQSNMTVIALLPSSLTLHISHTPLQSPHVDSEQANTNMVGIPQHCASFSEYFDNQNKIKYLKFDSKPLQSLQLHSSGSPSSYFVKILETFFFISIRTICQNLLNLDHVCYYLQNFQENQIEFLSCIL